LTSERYVFFCCWQNGWGIFFAADKSIFLTYNFSNMKAMKFQLILAAMLLAMSAMAQNPYA
jgi:hypothetical protein